MGLANITVTGFWKKDEGTSKVTKKKLILEETVTTTNSKTFTGSFEAGVWIIGVKGGERNFNNYTGPRIH